MEELAGDEITLDTITVKGLVYRKNGKNTAWVNDSNSYEGGRASQTINVKEENIYRDRVVVELPDYKANIILKVGQTFYPTTGNIDDIAAPVSSGK